MDKNEVMDGLKGLWNDLGVLIAKHTPYSHILIAFIAGAMIF